MLSLARNPVGMLVLSIAVALVLPMLLMDGMFMDAIMYTAVGNNLAHGYGSPWFLYYSVSHTESVPGFFENPPMAYWFFAIIFKIFGDHMLVERLYVFGIFLLTISLIVRLWKDLQPNSSKVVWLPVLLWIAVPLTFWGYHQNLMENTMTVFVIMAILFGWRAAKSGKNAWINSVIAGIFIFLAFMVKGFPGLFPLVTIAVYWLVYRDISFMRAVKLSLLMLAVGVGPIILLFFLPLSDESLDYYLFHRTLGRINQLPTVGNRFYILWDLLQQLLIPLGLVVLFWLPGRRAKFDKKAFWFLMLLGLCGVLPLCLTKVQRGFYLIPAIPVIVMALAVVIVPVAATWQLKLRERSRKLIYISAVVLLIATIITSVFTAGKPKRDQEILADIHQLGNIVGEHDTLASPKSIAHSWSTKAYLMRYYYIQLDYHMFEDHPEKSEFILLRKEDSLSVPGFEKVKRDLKIYALYRRVE